MSDPYRVSPAGIDADMKRLQWLNWADESDRGKVPKRPDATARNASSSDATTWSSFEDATDTAAGRDLGIGLSLAQPSPFVAIDIDVPDGEGWVPDLALGGAVVERSPSGNLRVYLRDVSVPEWWTDQSAAGKDTCEVKLFDDSGYVTVTGDVLDGHGPPIGDTPQAAFEQWLKEAWRAFADAGDEEPWHNDDGERSEPRAAQGTTVGQSGDLSADDARDALDHIDPDLPYDDWRDVGFALQDKFGDATAERLFKEWSRGGTKWDREAKNIAERIIDDAEQGGDRTIATVIYHAKNGGWTMPSRPRPTSDQRAETDGGVAAAPNAEPSAGPDGTDDGPDWDLVEAYHRDDEHTRREVRREAADQLLAHNEYAMPRPAGGDLDKTTLYRYWEEFGYFEANGAASINETLSADAPYLESRDVKEVVAHIRRASMVDRDAFDAGEHEHDLVNLENGVFDLDTGDLLDDDPEYLFRTVVPVEYDPDAECPAIEEFIESVVPGDLERETLFEWFGFCLSSGYSPHRFLMLTGSGGNGKGVLFRLLRAFLGGENVGSVGLRAMTSETSHDPAELERKLANVDADVPSQRIGSDETETIKKLTGGDEVQVHRKYGQPFDLDNRAKLTFAANEPPRFYGSTDGIPRRLLSIEFPYRFTNDPDDGHKDAVPEDELLAELTTDEELSGLLNRALAGLAHVRDEHQFSIEERGTARERFEEYMSDADSIAGFASGCLENRRGLAVPKDVVYSAYTAYCAANDHVPTDKGAFFRELGRKTDIETHTKQPRVDIADSRQPRVLDHLWITDDALAYLSRPAREDCATLVDHMHPDEGDYAHDMLLRTDAPDDAPDDDPDTSQSSRRAAIGDLVRDDGPVQRGEVANALDERGYDDTQVMADMETMISEGDLIRGDDSMTVRWNG